MFRIVGDATDGHRTETRLLPTSAAVLAMKWEAEGARRVMIEANGREYEIDAFRARFITPHERGGRRSR